MRSISGIHGVSSIVAAALLVSQSAESFTPVARSASTNLTPWSPQQQPLLSRHPTPIRTRALLPLSAEQEEDAKASDVESLHRESPFRLRRRFKQFVQPFQERSRRSVSTRFGKNVGPRLFASPESSSSGRHRFRWSRAFVTSSALLVGSTTLLASPRTAHANAPVMALPKAEDRDPVVEALRDQERKDRLKVQQALTEMSRKAKEIEATEGEAARVRFEQAYKAEQQAKTAAKKAGVEKLQRSLLQQGLDPFVDPEGRRQMMLYEKGVDTAQVPGTQAYMERMLQEKNSPKSQKNTLAAQRRIIACMVQDMKNRKLDYREYFMTHKAQTADILEMPTTKARTLAQIYTTNLQQYGQITEPKAGEKSLKEIMQEEAAAAAAAAMSPTRQKEMAKLEKQKARMEAKAEKERLKLQAQAEKEQVKREKEIAREQKKREQELERENAKRAKEAETVATSAAAITAAAAAGAAVMTPSVDVSTVTPQVLPNTVLESAPALFEAGGETENPDVLYPAPTLPSTASTSEAATSQKSKNLPTSVVLVGVGGGAAAIAGGYSYYTMYKEKSLRDEEERQRQLRLIMEGDLGGSKPKKVRRTSVEDDLDFLDDFSEAPKPTKTRQEFAPAPPVEKVAPSPAPAPPKRRRLGIFKKKDGRETDLGNLVSADATAPQFAVLVAKILTYGAPGRFPKVVALPGAMPMDEQFDIELAKQLLVEAREAAGIDVTQSVEILANVVNCMLIDIVDLASSSLKESDSKIMVNAINVVINFMNHAAALYDSVAEGVIITPVRYSGDLAKSKLEQMFSSYAVNVMMDMSPTTDGDEPQPDFQSRVDLLQDVFEINPKKAEGLLLKAVQKNMMEMMKNGGEGMEEMMKGMGGMPGMEGLLGGAGGLDGDGMPDQTQVKAMLEELKNAKSRGEIGKAELAEVRKAFEQNFGRGLKELSSELGDMSPEERELMELMMDVLEV